MRQICTADLYSQFVRPIYATADLHGKVLVHEQLQFFRSLPSEPVKCQALHALSVRCVQRHYNRVNSHPNATVGYIGPGMLFSD